MGSLLLMAALSVAPAAPAWSSPYSPPAGFPFGSPFSSGLSGNQRPGSILPTYDGVRYFNGYPVGPTCPSAPGLIGDGPIFLGTLPPERLPAPKDKKSAGKKVKRPPTLAERVKVTEVHVEALKQELKARLEVVQLQMKSLEEALRADGLKDLQGVQKQVQALETKLREDWSKESLQLQKRFKELGVHEEADRLKLALRLQEQLKALEVKVREDVLKDALRLQEVLHAQQVRERELRLKDAQKLQQRVDALGTRLRDERLKEAVQFENRLRQIEERLNRQGTHEPKRPSPDKDSGKKETSGGPPETCPGGVCPGVRKPARIKWSPLIPFTGRGGR
jgi:hypothetical protein